jgi:CheY-specific phosphatase CheX
MTTLIESEQVAQEFLSAFYRVWETSIGLPIQDAGEGPPDRAPIAASPAWFGSVAWIGGSWTGNVTLSVEPAMATAIARALVPGGEPSEPEINDALREVANMVAGNVKATLAGICGLATPGSFRVTTARSGPFEDFVPLVVRWMEGDQGLLRISLSEIGET